MNLAKISCNGQITVPMEIRRALQVKTGDKIVFLHKNNGEIIIQSVNNLTDASQTANNRAFSAKALAQV